MTIDISDNSPRVSYSVSEGVTQTSFTVSFEFFDNEDLNVYVDGVLKTLTSDYTVTGGDGSTGTVSMSVTGGAGGSTVVITRDIALERTTDFPISGPFNITTLNTELDRLVAIAADLEDQASRALQLTDYDAAVSLTLPDVDNRKGKVLAFNATTGAVESGPSIADVQTVSAASADIAVLADIEDGTDATDAIQTVAGIAANVTTVAGNSANVTTVAGISANVTTVAGISSDVAAVSADATDIGIVSTNIADVNTAAANITAIQNASANATAAAASATAAAASESAAATSETNAATSEANAAASYDLFDDRFLGAKSSAPTLDNDGDALVAGALYFDTTAGAMYVWNGSAWQSTEYNSTAVDINGGSIDGTPIGASSASTGAFTSATISGDLTVDTNTLYVDSTNNRVGVGNTSPATALDVTGTVTADGAETDSFDSSGTSLEIKSGARVRGVGGGEFQISSGVTNDASEPTYTFRGDPDTGIFWGGANTVGITTGGSEAMRIDSSGNVGIGTSSPSGDLDIYRATSDPDIRLTRNTTQSRIATTSDGGLRLQADYGNTAAASFIQFSVDGSEAARIDDNGDFLVGYTTSNIGNAGISLRADNAAYFARDGGAPVLINRNTNDGTLVNFRQDNTTLGSIGADSGQTYIVGANSGIRFGVNSGILPTNSSGTSVDNRKDLGALSVRWDDVYATNGTIQTSDRNEKQDIAELDEAEKRVAIAAKGLIRKYRWKDAVAEKGDDARIHFGIIAQDLQDAFAAEGLDAGRYAMFISSTWWETQTEVPAVEAVAEVLDKEGNVVTEAVEAKEAYTRTDTYETLEEAPEGATERTRLGVRYPELLAFIIGAL